MIAVIEAQGSLLSLKVLGYKSKNQGHSHKRGIIRVFSQAARRRLLRFMARLKTRKIRASFITLTITEMVSNDRAKQVFKRFSMRLRRRYPFASCIWRMEYQPKRGAIHFHLLCFNIPFWKQAELQKTWEACTEEPMSIVHIKLVHGARSVMGYISKYIAKLDNDRIASLEDGSYQHEARDDMSGRYWGWINKKCLPLGEVVTGILTDRQTIKALSSFIWSLLGSDNPYNSISFHYFCDNARWLCERAIEEGGCEWDEWEYEVRDHDSPTPQYTTYTGIFQGQELNPKEVLVLGRLVNGERSEFMQPLTNDWTARASFSFPALVQQDFKNEGTIVYIVPYSKGHNDGAL